MHDLHGDEQWAIVDVEMKPEHWITLGNLIVTAVGLYVGPKIAVRRSVEQFRSQKWWERKAAAYDDVIRSASRLCSYNVESFDDIIMHRSSSEESTNVAIEKNREALAVLEAFRYSGGFVILDEAGEAVKRILAASAFGDCEDAATCHDRVSDVMLKELKVLRECAAKDLNITVPKRFGSKVAHFVAAAGRRTTALLKGRRGRA